MGKERFESRGLGDQGQLVEKIKEKAGGLDDLIKECDKGISNDVCTNLKNQAIIQLESAVMFATKAVSRRTGEPRK